MLARVRARCEHALAGRDDFIHASVVMNFDPAFSLEGLRRVRHQFVGRGHTGEVIRDPTGAIGNVGTLFKHRDIQPRIQSPGSGCSSQTCRISANNENLLH